MYHLKNITLTSIAVNTITKRVLVLRIMSAKVVLNRIPNNPNLALFITINIAEWYNCDKYRCPKYHAHIIAGIQNNSYFNHGRKNLSFTAEGQDDDKT